MWETGICQQRFGKQTCCTSARTQGVNLCVTFHSASRQIPLLLGYSHVNLAHLLPLPPSVYIRSCVCCPSWRRTCLRPRAWSSPKTYSPLSQVRLLLLSFLRIISRQKPLWTVRPIRRRHRESGYQTIPHVFPSRSHFLSPPPLLCCGRAGRQAVAGELRGRARHHLRPLPGQRYTPHTFLYNHHLRITPYSH